MCISFKKSHVRKSCIFTALQMGSQIKQKHKKDVEGVVFLWLLSTCQTIKTVMNYTLLYKILLSEAKLKFVVLKVSRQIFSLRKNFFLVFYQERIKISCWIQRFNFYWITYKLYHRKHLLAKLTWGYLENALELVFTTRSVMF